MGKTVLGLFCVCLAAALAELLLPHDEGRGTKGVLRVLVSLAVLLLLLRPFVSFLGSDPTVQLEELVGESEEDTAAGYEEIFSQAVIAGSERDLKQGLYAWLLGEHGIDARDAHIKITLGDGGSLLRVEIFLSGAALLRDPDVLERELSELLNCETEVR